MQDLQTQVTNKMHQNQGAIAHKDRTSSAIFQAPPLTCARTGTNQFHQLGSCSGAASSSTECDSKM